MFYFIYDAAETPVTAGGRSGTPILEIPNIVDGSLVKVTCNFYANTEQNDPATGFGFEIKPTKPDDATELTGGVGVVTGGGNGWRSVTKIAFFEVRNAGGETGVDDIDFEVNFSDCDGGLSGTGVIRDFLLSAEVRAFNPLS